MQKLRSPEKAAMRYVLVIPPFFYVITPRKNPLLVPKLISFFRSLQKVHLHLLDLSKPKDITKFTKDFVDSGQQLDVLVSRKQDCTNTQ